MRTGGSLDQPTVNGSEDNWSGLQCIVKVLMQVILTDWKLAQNKGWKEQKTRIKGDTACWAGSVGEVGLRRGHSPLLSIQKVMVAKERAEFQTGSFHECVALVITFHFCLSNISLTLFFYPSIQSLILMFWVSIIAKQCAESWVTRE